VEPLSLSHTSPGGARSPQIGVKLSIKEELQNENVKCGRSCRTRKSRPPLYGKDDAHEKQKPTRLRLYTRVSTDQQMEAEFNSCDAQEERIRSFIASQEGFVMVKVYSDPGYTGANIARPGLQRLLADVKAGLLDMVITYKIDRLTRSPRRFYQLVELFEAQHVGYISVTERFDTSTPAGGSSETLCSPLPNSSGN